MTISVVLADDHPIVRRGMRAILESLPDLTILAETDNGLDAVQLVEQLRPRVLVLDLKMPGMSGLEVLPIVSERSPKTRVVVISMHDGSEFVAAALKSGAAGYVLKGSNEENLAVAVREAAAGRRFLSPQISERALKAYAEQSGAAQVDPYEALTEREREVLQLSAKGMTASEIGSSLHVSRRTVENHRAHLMRKLGVRNQTELVRYALRRGLIQLDEWT